MIEETSTVLEPQAMRNFVETPYIKEITKRALYYIKAGFPVHFRGVSGTGKTTLAMHVANKIGRPVVMIHGDEEFSTSDLVGGEYGYHAKKIIDNFIHSVLKTEENVSQKWIDNRLTVACKYGFSLIYDEFTRSRPEANNVLLSVLQERILDLPSGRSAPNNNCDENYLKVHPNFTAMFTSNPEEYAGVHRSQDALRDRMITLDLDYFDHETEVAITMAKSGLSRAESERIVDIVRSLRKWGEYEFAPTVRGCIMIAKTLKVVNSSADKGGKLFLNICQDILASETSRLGKKANQEKVKMYIEKLVNSYCKPQPCEKIKQH